MSSRYFTLCILFDCLHWFPQLTGSICISFLVERSLISMRQKELSLFRCSSSHCPCSTMCISFVNSINHGHITQIWLFMDFSWNSICPGELWNLSRQGFPRYVWVCLQKYLFWVCLGIQNLVWCQQQLWNERRETPECDHQPNTKHAEKHQKQKYQQFHLVARED